MTRAVFYSCDSLFTGFTVSGHTDSEGSLEARLVCAAVSSAVYLTAHAITDIIRAKAAVSESDGRLTVRLSAPDGRTQDAVAALKLHLEGLREQYGNYIAINTEVQHDA